MGVFAALNSRRWDRTRLPDQVLALVFVVGHNVDWRIGVLRSAGPEIFPLPHGIGFRSAADRRHVRRTARSADVIVAQSDQALRRILGDLDAQVGLPAELKELLRDRVRRWSHSACTWAPAMHASRHTHARTITVFGCAPSLGSVRLALLRWWPRWALHATSSTDRQLLAWLIPGHWTVR